MKAWMMALVAAPLVAFSPMIAPAHAQTTPDQPDQPQVDYDRFAQLTAEVAPWRAQRLLSREAFFAKAAEEGVLLLDTRSAEAFAAGHIEGAVNLPFSDFTAEKLRAVIGEDMNRAILIYCNNNFTDDAFPVVLKNAPLALNIPTFINLVGYGYANVWELEGAMPVSEVPWVSEAEPAQLATAR